MKQYLMSVHYVEGQPASAGARDPDTMQQIFADVETFNQQLQDAGAWVFAGGLQEPHLAAVVREHDGDILVTDGPFPEAKEQLGGVWIITADDFDGACGWAQKATRACRGPVEVRPFQEEPPE